MSQISAVLIFGAPGSGKGTVGAKLAATTALKHLSTGDIFRGIAPSSESGKLLASYSSKGLLVPDEATVEIFGRFVEGLVNTNKLNPEKDTLLLDGIPRTVAQVDLIKPIVDVKHIFVLDIKDEETIVARLLNRAKIEGRKDDADVNVIKNRLNVYKESTAKVLEKYDPKIISHIVGDNTPGKWNLKEATPLQPTSASGIYSATLRLTASGSFKIATDKDGDYSQKFFFRDAANSGKISEDGTGDRQWTIGEDGDYTVTVDMNQMTISIEKQGSVQPTPAPIDNVSLYLVGDNTPGGWRLWEATPLQPTSASGIYAPYRGGIVQFAIAFKHVGRNLIYIY